MGTGLTACSNSSQDETATKTNVSKKKKISEFHKIGETVKVGKVTYTLKSVKTTKERNQFADSKPKHVIKVTYHVKNNSKDDLSIGTDLDVYGPNNQKLKEYPLNDQTFDSIAAGKEAKVVTGFGTNKLGKFELHFEPLASFDAKAEKYKVNIK